jgi:hypothetical protein
MESTNNWRNKYLIAGTALGALFGLMTAYLLARAASEKGGGPPEISTSEAIKIAIGLISTMRGIASIGDK